MLIIVSFTVLIIALVAAAIGVSRDLRRVRKEGK
jgi:hypothetical protein